MSRRSPSNCSDCDNRIDRRSFVRKVGGAALAGAVAPSLLDMRMVHAAPSPESVAETVVGQFYASLSAQQREAVCFPFNHALSKKISANWHITEPLIGGDFYSNEQRELIRQIVRGVTSEDGYEKLIQQMKDDDGGIEGYAVAVFGSPGAGKFQWELTGRHLTLRADGDNVDRAAFGGPIIYGHGESTPKDNLFHYQTKQANEVYRSLDSAQSKRALLSTAPDENAVPIQGNGGGFPGIAVSELSADQKNLVERTLKVLLGVYRPEDVQEVMAILKASGGLDKLHMAFYQEEDINEDQVWDIWRVEGPSLVWHFRGAPHVHAYINIGQKA